MKFASATATDQSRTRVDSREFSSFRDPAGYLFWREGQIFRRVLDPYAAQFRAASENGLYAQSVKDGLLLPFEVVADHNCSEATVAVLRPRQLTFVTHPFEWSFDELKDAAIVTLELHIRALQHEMLLKDASAYNIQFVDGQPCLIDHLSFDFVSEYSAWPAYGQFCRHFLAPLALMSYVDLSLGKLLQLHLDGIPLDLASALLPRRSRLSLGLYVHLHLHSKMLTKHAGTTRKLTGKRLSAAQMSTIAGSMLSLIKKLRPKKQTTEWDSYYEGTNYSSGAFDAKKRCVIEMVARVRPKTLWDVGGNNGEFSRAVVHLVDEIVCMDIDPRAVNANYLSCKRDGIRNILPLIVDITNPSPGVGFANKERRVLNDRGRPDVILALALVHHLAISHNLPFDHIAAHFAGRCDHLLMEFVEKSDSQVQKLLLNRQDVFPDYCERKFREAFECYFGIEMERRIPDCERTLFLFRSKLHA